MRQAGVETLAVSSLTAITLLSPLPEDNSQLLLSVKQKYNNFATLISWIKQFAKINLLIDQWFKEATLLDEWDASPICWMSEMWWALR